MSPISHNAKNDFYEPKNSSQQDDSVAKQIENIMALACQKKASDIHFEPQQKNYRLRLRIDGLLHVFDTFELALADKFSAYLKILARLDIANKRLPQDGRLLFTWQNNNYDLRLSTCPTAFGEKIVIRILNTEQFTLDINQLGFLPSQKEKFINALHRPEGMILVTGPTGSGKTITLYSALNLLNSTDKNILTIEDPVEIILPGITQVAVQNKIGFHFATALRTFLRQDPDIIMIGEIRDLETAEIAIKAAQTGHLVLATLHTSSALEAITRLLNMGISAFDIASVMNLIISQRLVRKLCQYCKKNSAPAPANVQSLPAADNNYSSASPSIHQNNCQYCHDGFLGRTGIFEFLPFSKKIAHILMEKKCTSLLDEIAKDEGMITLEQAALSKINKGVTTISEIKRVI